MEDTLRSSRLQLAAVALAGSVALSGCQGISGAGQYTRVRFIEVSPDAPPLDMYQNSAPLLYSIGFGTASSYIPISPGAYTYTADTATSHQQLGSAAATLAAGAQYTVLVGNTTAALQVSILKDQATPAPAGQYLLRVLHQATRVGAVDLYLVPAGGKLAGTAPFATSVTFGNTPVYGMLPSGTYSLVALPAGASPSASPVPLYTGSNIEYPAGAARTIVLIDTAAASAVPLQALSADDFDLPATTL